MSDSCYRLAHGVWIKFNIKKLGKYEDLPNMWDFLLLLAIIADFNIYV